MYDEIDLTKKAVEFRFGETGRQAFNIFKSQLMNAPILSLYSPQDETELHCDAAGFGAILLQRKADRKFLVFYSSKRTEREA